jgi:3-oxoadipyl-CoA thiolase
MDAYIIDAIRTPIGSLGGSLSPVRTDDLAAMVLKELAARNKNLPVDAIDDVIIGCHNQAGEDNRNVARMALLLAGLPFTVPGETVNRLCASGMSAVINASRGITCGDGDIYFAGGVEHMTRGPWVISKSSKPFGNDSRMFDSSFGWRFVNPRMEVLYGTDAMGVTAENLADQYKISRDEQDLFAFRSQQKAVASRAAGRFTEEIMPVPIEMKNGSSIFDQDEFIKPATTLEKLATLKPAFRKEGGTVTAGNSSGLNDGAAALLLASGEAVNRHAFKPIARIIASAYVGVEPRIMGIGPVGATAKVLKKAGLRLDQVDVIEINEAFAAQVIACLREMRIHNDDPRINPNGGAIALGHPLGVSGARLVMTAARELQKTGRKIALATMCVGVGQGAAILLERV